MGPGSLAQPGGWPWELSSPVVPALLLCVWTPGPSFHRSYFTQLFIWPQVLLSYEYIIYMSLPLFLGLVNF